MRNQVEHYFLTKDKIEEGVNLCLEKVKTILSDVEILCNNSGSESVAVALFTIAIEEYGKSILLQDCMTQNPESDGSFRVSPTIFGIKT